MADFFHGARSAQVPTSLIPPANVNASLIMAWGCAPIHRLPAEQRELAMPGRLVLCYTTAEAGTKLGISYRYDDKTIWGLSEVAYNKFELFNDAPAIFANAFNPDVHFEQITNEAVSLTLGRGKLANGDIIDSVMLTGTGGPLAEGTDYEVNLITGEIEAIVGGGMASLTSVTATYKRAAPEMVTSDDIIGGYDIVTGITTGLSLVDKAFPWFSMVPGVLIAPGFSEDPIVAAIMAAKTQKINGVFNAVAMADIPSDGANGVTLYTDVPKYKNDNNLVSENLYMCWPKIKFGDEVFHMSTQAACLLAQVDSARLNLPYASPSNKNLQCTDTVLDDRLDLLQVNYLNANGVTTALNFVGGWKLWGNRMACFPAVTDPKDTFLSSRRMMAWYGNQLVLTWFQKVDDPINRRLIHTIINSEQINLNALTSAGALLGGRIEIRDEENSILDLMDGMITFHIMLGLTIPAEDILFLLEYDPSFIQALFA